MPFELRCYSDLSRHIKKPQNWIYCLFLKRQHLNAETMFHTKSNLFCFVCWHAVVAMQCKFHFMRTYGVREPLGLSHVAAVTKGGGGFAKVQLHEILVFDKYNDSNMGVSNDQIFHFNLLSTICMVYKCIWIMVRVTEKGSWAACVVTLGVLACLFLLKDLKVVWPTCASGFSCTDDIMSSLWRLCE